MPLDNLLSDSRGSVSLSALRIHPLWQHPLRKSPSLATTPRRRRNEDLTSQSILTPLLCDLPAPHVRPLEYDLSD